MLSSGEAIGVSADVVAPASEFGAYRVESRNCEAAFFCAQKIENCLFNVGFNYF